jgi:hypothetical protein
MAHKRSCFSFVVALALVSLTLASCSKSESTDKAAVQSQPFTEQAKEAIQDYGRRPINKARMTQDLGDQRIEAMDAAVKATAGQ